MNPIPPIRQAILAAVVAALALSACAMPLDWALPTEPGEPATQTARLCSTSSSQATPGVKVMRSRGNGWRYEQHLPGAYGGQSTPPLVIVLGAASLEPEDLEGLGSDAIVIGVPKPNQPRWWTPVDRDERFVRDLILRAEESLCFDRSDVHLAGIGIGADVAEHVIARLDDERVQYLEIEPS